MLAVEYRGSDTRNDVWILSVPSGTAAPFLATEAAESEPVFSPDSRWLAYVSDESGRQEVYVVGHPDPGRRTQISSAGGQRPRWSPDGKELFYMTDGGEVVAVPLAGGATTRVGQPQRLFQLAGLVDYDPHPDGERFAVIQRPFSPETQLHVVLNWHTELERLVPTN